MKNKKVIFFCKILLLSICFNACVKDIDLDQAEDIELSPEIAVSLLNFDFSVDDLDNYDTSMDFDVVVDEEIMGEVLFSRFDDSLFQEDLDRIVIKFEGSNTFNETFVVTLTFFDENDTITHELAPITIPANSVGPYPEREIVILNSPNILNSTKIEGSSAFQGTVNPSEERNLTINTAGTFHFTIN